jgi:hypothetical protein
MVDMLQRGGIDTPSVDALRTDETQRDVILPTKQPVVRID